MIEPQSAGYEIVRYRPEHRSQVLELQTYMWSPDLEINSAYLDWKYYDNPFMGLIGEPIIYLALHEDRVVGMRAMYGTCWQGGQPSKTMRWLSDADTVVHPEHRRRGLSERMTVMMLADLAHSDYEYVVALSANPASSALVLKLGWRSVGFLQPTYWHPQRGEASHVRKLAHALPVLPSAYRRLRSYVDKATSPPSAHRSPFAALDGGGNRTRQDGNTHISVEKEPRPRAMAELIERIGADGRIRHVRDERFFAWRFQNPLSEYRFLFWESDRLDGYLVLQTPACSHDGGWVTIVDWEATSTEIQADLVRTAILCGRFDTLVAWLATLSGEAKGVLQENGFRLPEETESLTQASFRHALLMRPILPEKLELDWESADRRLLDMSNWDLRAIYSDNY